MLKSLIVESNLMKTMHYLALFFLIFLSSCASNVQQSDPVPVHDSFILDSKLLGEKRIINVWKPSEYPSTNSSFPVLYMADGGIKEDFPHLANTVAKLIKEKRIRPVILVGIENTQRRRDLTGFTNVEEDKKIAAVVGGSATFRDFIKEELFPEINKRYRTTQEKSIIGESLAGLFIMETFFTSPEMFDNYIAIDPSLWWNNHHLTSTAKEYLTKFPAGSQKKLWFASSKEPSTSEFTQQISQTLKSANIPNLKWNYSPAPTEEHSTIFRAVKEKALIWSLNGN